MKRILLTALFFPFFYFIQGQNPDLGEPPVRTHLVARIGLNALNQAPNRPGMNAKSSLGFHVGGDVIWDPGWKIKAGFLYQHHEIFELNNQQGSVPGIESQDRRLQRLKLSAGTLYDFINIDFLTIGIGADLAYNFNITDEPLILQHFGNSFKIDYLSSIFHIYTNINRIQIDLGVEGNITSKQKKLGFFKSRTYALTFGYIF